MARRRASSRRRSISCPDWFIPMTEPTKWPAYDVGPESSLLAIGVAGVNYATLEFTLAILFAMALGIDIDVTNALFARLGNEARTSLLATNIPQDWPDPAPDLVRHFIDGFSKCAENRNHLMHSSVHLADFGFELPGNASALTILAKMNKRGERILAFVDEVTLRQVADDMHTYAQFGLELQTSVIAATAKSDLVGLLVHRAGRAPWPDKPPLPQLLRYMPALSPKDD